MSLPAATLAEVSDRQGHATADGSDGEERGKFRDDESGCEIQRERDEEQDSRPPE